MAALFLPAALPEPVLSYCLALVFSGWTPASKHSPTKLEEAVTVASVKKGEKESHRTDMC